MRLARLPVHLPEAPMQPSRCMQLGVALMLGCAVAGQAAAAPSFGTDVAAISNSSYIDFNGTHPWFNFNCDFASLGGKEGWCGPGLRQSDALVARALGDAQLGTIHGEAVGAAINSAQIRSFGGASVDASWWDTFTAIGSGLPPGTQADLHVKVVLDATVDPSIEYPSPYTRAQAAFTLGGPDGAALASVKLLDDGSLEAEGDLMIDLDVPVVLFGRYLGLTQVSSFASPDDAGSSVGTAHYFVQINTPGVELRTGSGTDYRENTPGRGLPIPGTGLLVLLGAALMAARRSRHEGPLPA